MKYNPARNIIAIACAHALACSVVLADYQVPLAVYAAPASYYSTASGIGATLKFNLNEIIDGHTLYTYSNTGSDAAMRKLDEDPNESNNVLLVYNGVSIAKSAVLNTNYNREHLWPNSYGLDNTNRAFSDLYNLRVCDANVNSDRGNEYYDDIPVDVRKIGNDEAPDTWEDIGDTRWEPRAIEKGELARAMFYMDTRYEGHANDDFARNLELTDNVGSISTSNNNMGKRSTLLKWHYEHGVSNQERRRNHLLFTDDETASGWNGTARNQGNRNPFVDHPEYVWAVFGGGVNNSKLYVSAAAPGSGASTATVDLGPVIVGAALGTGTFSLKKDGTHPTTYDITTTGSATTASAGTGQTIAENVLSRSIAVGLSASTATAGLKSGTVVINNTDLTTGGTGQGSDDGNDTVNVTAGVLSHAKASFNSGSPLTNLTLDFGTVAQGIGDQTLPLGISNLVTTAGFTAGLDLDGISGIGNIPVLSSNIVAVANIVAGTTQAYLAKLNTDANGNYSATYTITNSDVNIPGATNGTSLVLNLTGQVKTRQWFVNADDTWSDSAAWLGPVPSAAGNAANFLNVITAPRTVTLDGDRSAGSFTFDSSHTYTIIGGSTLTLAGGSGASVNVARGNHEIDAALKMDSDTSVAIDANSQLTVTNLQESTHDLAKSGGGTLRLNVARVHALNIDSGAVEIAPNGLASGVSKLTTLSLAPGVSGGYLGTLDLHDNDLVIDYGQGASPYAEVLLMIRSGLLALGGDGSGLTSSEVNLQSLPGTMLAVVDNGVAGGLQIGSISGFSDFTPESVLVKYTWIGDANLDGVVDGSDYALADTGFSGGGTGWYYGDINYDGIINGSDYALIDTGFSSQTGPLPEPGMLIGIVAMASAVLGRKRLTTRAVSG